MEELASVSGFYFRAVSLEYSGLLGPNRTIDPLDGVGASLRGGRCNPVGVRAVYLAGDLETAVRESVGTSNLYGVKAIKPRVLSTVCVVADGIVDLTSPAVRRRLGITLADIRSPWRGRPTTKLQTLCERLHAEGVKGVLYPSNRGGGTSLAIFPANLEEQDVLRVEDHAGV